MPDLNISRRTLFLTTAAALAAPAILSRASFAQEASEPPMTATPQTKSFKIGKFAVSTIRDGKVVAEKPQETFGTDQKPEENQSRVLNFFSPELTLALPDYPQYEVIARYMHRSGIFGTYNGVWEGANSFVLGFRYRF